MSLETDRRIIGFQMTHGMYHRACGIAPDGTRVNEKEFEGIPSSTEPSEKVPSGIAEKSYPIPDDR